jgi:CheY-like chemotaxis protein
VVQVLAGADGTPKRTILLAGNARTIRRLVRTALERRGYEVVEAQSAAEMFQTLDMHRPDVLLLDVGRGAEDGLALAAGLRQEPRLRSMRIVFMTEAPDTPELRRLSRRWDVPVLMRPFDFEALLEAIG